MTSAPDSFTPRPYPDIVRDLLTTLTGGTVRETAIVPAGEVIELRLLQNRPIRRISHLQGEVEIERPVRNEAGDIVIDLNGDPEIESVGVPYRFTDVDFELFSTGSSGDEFDALRFRSTGRHPSVGSTVTINYYPTQTSPVPITDLNVGSVARTMIESVARELAVEELLLENVYKSAFLDTAEGINLDKVVALVGIKRRPPGVATARVRFLRASGTTGRITIPAATTVSDADGNRFATVTPLIIEPGEPSREVLTAATVRSTPAVESNSLDRLELLIAGIASVTNDSPAVAASAPESDDELRRRARGALAVAARGTVDALKFGLLSLPGVKDVVVTEFPNGVAGEIKIDVAYDREGDSDLERQVAERIEDLRPAGIRVLTAPATTVDLTVNVVLTLAGTGVAASELDALQSDVENRVVSYLQSLPPGGTVRQAQAVVVTLSDPRIVDAAFEFALGGSPAQTVTAAAGTVMQPVQPFTFTVNAEQTDAAHGRKIEMDVLVPLRLVSGVTAAEAESMITTAATSFANALTGGNQITVDALAAALRDDTRYQLIRSDIAVTTEAEDRFLQLADGIGAHPVGTSDQVLLRTLNIDIREGDI